VSGSLTNSVFFISHPAAKTLLLRIYGPSSSCLVSRPHELHVLHVLSSRYGFGPQVYGTFANGRVEQYFESEALTASEMRDPQVSAWIGMRMAELHCVDLNSVDLKHGEERDGVRWNVRRWLGPALLVAGAILPLTALLLHNTSCYGAPWKNAYSAFGGEAIFATKYLARNAHDMAALFGAGSQAVLFWLGLADLVIERAAPGTLWYWINLGNYTFSERKVITGMPTGIGLNAVIRWADLNGNGTTDLIYADNDSSPKIRTVDIGEIIGCGSMPNILTIISSGIGHATLVGYQPSTRFALDDAAAGRAWPNPMPFPVTVVACNNEL